jgi:chemotaxis protein methyltransferase CheR
MSLAPNDLAWVRDLVRSRAAIVIEDGKEYLVESRLGALARSSGYDSLTSLVMAARTNRDVEARVIEAMTINETSFFRDLHPFDGLRTTVMPDLLLSRARTKTLRVWSAASSSGQEPWSIAMLLHHEFPQLATWDVKILATDLSSAMVERSRLGVYSQLEVNRGLPANFMLKYFDREGASFRIREELRRIVEFRAQNLVEPWPFQATRFDVVFIRNVLIYFDVPTKRAILERIHRILAPDGYLFLGGSETTIQIHEGFERVQSGRAVWYRVLRPRGDSAPKVGGRT